MVSADWLDELDAFDVDAVLVVDAVLPHPVNAPNTKVNDVNSATAFFFIRFFLLFLV
jgi:hypothetical protein